MASRYGSHALAPGTTAESVNTSATWPVLKSFLIFPYQKGFRGWGWGWGCRHRESPEWPVSPRQSR